jgi:hypothetical protein
LETGLAIGRIARLLAKVRQRFPSAAIPWWIGPVPTRPVNRALLQDTEFRFE